MPHALSVPVSKQPRRCPTCCQRLPEVCLGASRQDREHAAALGLSSECYSHAFGADFRERAAFIRDQVLDLLGAEDCRGVVKLSENSPTLVLTVGVSAGLAVRRALGERHVAVWSVGNVSALAAVDLPSWAKEVVVATDNDSAYRDAAYRLGRRCTERGLTCRIMLPPAGSAIWSDVAVAEVPA